MSFKGHDRTMPQIGSIFCDCHQAFGIKIKGLKFLPILAPDPPLSLSLSLSLLLSTKMPWTQFKALKIIFKNKFSKYKAIPIERFVNTQKAFLKMVNFGQIWSHWLSGKIRDDSNDVCTKNS